MQTLPAVRSLKNAATVHALSRPARTFTGDFYLTHRHGERLWLAIGDVAGKGLPAAIVMAMIQEELERRIASCAEAACDPSRTMMRLHQFLLPLLPKNRFATAVIGWLDADGTLTLANAGHCPPLVVRAGGTVEQIGSTGPVAGVLPGSRWTSVTRTLDPGDALVLYSDGVIEATADGKEVGVDGLREIVRETGAAPQEILARIPTPGDDATLLIVRR